MENKKPNAAQLIYAYDALCEVQEVARKNNLSLSTSLAIDVHDHTVHFRIYDFCRTKENSIIYDGMEIPICEDVRVAEEKDEVITAIEEYIENKNEYYASEHEYDE